MKNDLDSIVFRLLYGVPMAGFSLGGEIQLDYYNEKKETKISEQELRTFYLNLPIDGGGNFYNLFPISGPGQLVGQCTVGHYGIGLLLLASTIVAPFHRVIR